MRIIAGQWRGRNLLAPTGAQTTRPTSDRAREALFSILLPWLSGARVLDLFAGSGALALEALSRGAAYAVLCDRDREACAAIGKNIATLSAQERTLLLEQDAAHALKGLAGDAFDLIFLDPPYRAGLAQDALVEIARGGLLAPGGRIIVESAADDLPEPPPGLMVADRRKYGVAVLTMMEREDDA